ncbi:MAG: DUF3422 domain-containing protein [Alphaproteobacteria bacterium]|nr:DUF3422 domain-containing protein [Alphaproteobacteria bacterium]
MDEFARQTALAELHARPAPKVGVSGHVTRLAFLFNEHGADATQHAIAHIANLAGAPPPPAGARYHAVAMEGREIRWELHTEFVTYTIVSGGDGRSEALWETLVREAGLDAAHGQLAAKIAVSINQYKAAGARDSVCVSTLASGRAQLTTGFHADEDGFVRFYLQHSNLDEDETGALVQSILEIETYRMLALMALPLARRIGARLQDFDAELGAITRSAEHEGNNDTASAFAALSELSARVESELASASFRFAAALAYGAIAEDRIRSLGEQGAGERPQAGAFLLARLNPALRTCSSMRQALSDLAQRCMRATDMIRTRIDLQLAQQNNSLLNALNERTRLQTRLQQTVEGLSIAALSYYVVGLIGYAAKGAKDAGWIKADANIVMAVSVPVVIAAAGFVIYRIRRMHRLHE